MLFKLCWLFNYRAGNESKVIGHYIIIILSLPGAAILSGNNGSKSSLKQYYKMFD